MRQIKILVFLSLPLLATAGCGRVDISSAPTVSSTFVGTNQVAPTSSQATQSPPTTTLVSAIKGWKVYVDDVYHFSFSYPANFTVEDTGVEKLVKNESGTNLIYVGLYSRALDEEIKANIKRKVDSDYLGNSKLENILFKKIVDTTTTLGHLSQWKATFIYIPGDPGLGGILSPAQTIVETRAVFESKLGVSNLNNKKNIILLEVSHDSQSKNSISLDLFRRIVSTFQFNQ